MRIILIFLALILFAGMAYADSVVVISASYLNNTNTDDNYLAYSFSPVAYGAADTLCVGHAYDGEAEPPNYARRIIINPALKVARDSINMADSAISCACSLLVKAQTGIGTDDSLVLTALLKDFSETISDWAHCSTGVHWTTAGAGSDGNDYKNVVISKIPVPANAEWAVFDCKSALDSIVAYRWNVQGWRITLNDESSTATETVRFYSVDHATTGNRPNLQYDYAYKIMTGGQRHGERNRHGQPSRHGG